MLISSRERTPRSKRPLRPLEIQAGWQGPGFIRKMVCRPAGRCHRHAGALQLQRHHTGQGRARPRRRSLVRAPSFYSRTPAGRRICLRFGSAEHTATVWVNGKQVAHHAGGFLPFEADISEAVRFGENNRISVMVDNTDWDSLPSGFIKSYDDSNHPPGFPHPTTPV
jgi:hypothetical protein